MANPRNADLAFTNLRKLRRRVFAGSLYEQRWNQNAGQEIAFVPVGARTQSDAGGMPQWNRSFIGRALNNHNFPDFFPKSNWEGLKKDRNRPQGGSVKTLQTSHAA